ncbi:MAG: class I SAM-dependent methyltransferase [bacterium]
MLERLQKTFPNISYTGVDISYNLLAIANENHPNARWVHKDMVSFLSEAEQETYDCIIAVASFHHLPHEPARLEALNGMYQSLSYDGICIMTNRCYSDRFKKKYKKEITQARRKVLWSLGYSDRHDIMVPWK